MHGPLIEHPASPLPTHLGDGRSAASLRGRIRPTCGGQTLLMPRHFKAERSATSLRTLPMTDSAGGHLLVAAARTDLQPGKRL
jgi:hypothetical protein